MKYRIKDWNQLFENNRTRELKRMDWVPIPNRMDGEGYTALVDHPAGAAHFGAWVAILEIASRRDVRGTLPQEGAEIPQALARMSHLPARLFEEVLPRLLKIGWIEQLSEIPQEGAEIPQDDAEECLRARVTERNGMEGKEDSLRGIAFALKKASSEIHQRHPQKRRDCSAAIVEKKLKTILRHQKIVVAESIAYIETVNRNHASLCASDDWRKENGTYAKALTNWLAPTQSRYENGNHQEKAVNRSLFL